MALLMITNMNKSNRFKLNMIMLKRNATVVCTLIPWMTHERHYKIMVDFRRNMHSSKNRVLFMCNNASLHQIYQQIIHYNNMNVVRLTPNTTSIL